jgi:alpha/beta hydrolase fold
MVKMKFFALSILCLSVWWLQPAQAQVTSSMLVQMREILSVSVSPDGSHAVMEISQGNTKTNHMDLSWVIVSTLGDSTPIVVPAGEEIFNPEAAGAQLNASAVWDREGHWFYYLRRDGHEVQLWKTDVQGKRSGQLTHSKSDLVGVSASSNSRELHVLLGMPRDQLNRLEEQEDRDGVLYGDRILGEGPLTRSLPAIDRYRNVRWADDHARKPTGWTAPTSAEFDTVTGILRASTLIPEAAKTCTNNCAISSQYRALVVAIGTPVPSERVYSKYAGLYSIELESLGAGAAMQRCALAECQGNRVTLLGWSSDESELYFAAQSQTAHVHPRLPGVILYAWNPTSNRVKTIFEPHGRLYNIDLPLSNPLTSVPVINKSIVVATDGPDEPPRLISIDLATGLARELYDANPALRALTKDRAHWRTWPGADDYPGRGVIILPENFRPGFKYPLIITTYGCDVGLLKGGGADGTPEFVAAQQGFISVCLEVPAWELTAREADDLSRIYPIACDIVAALIDDQVRSGSVDPSRIGLSGQSFGANFGAYCLARSLKKGSPHSVAAAALRGASMNEVEQRNIMLTNAFYRDPVNGLYARMRLPDPRHDPEGKWDAISTASKADEFNTPLLIQDDEEEYLLSLPLWNALREARKPVELIVYPQELHRLIQPIHQLLNFERQIDWFRFWLQDKEDSAPEKQPQYERWRHLRELTH